MFPRPRGRAGLVLGCLAAAALIAVGWAVRNHVRYKHFAVHDDGLVYRSAWLEADAMEDVIEDYQIRTVVNLCNFGEMGQERWYEERRIVKNAGARLVELPMPMSIDASEPVLKEHIRILADPNNYPMLVHCQHGVTRTAKMLSIYDILMRGMSGEASLSAQPLFGRDDHNVNVRAFVRNFEKKREQLYPQISGRDLEILRR